MRRLIGDGQQTVDEVPQKKGSVMQMQAMDTSLLSTTPVHLLNLPPPQCAMPTLDVTSP